MMAGVSHTSWTRSTALTDEFFRSLDLIQGDVKEIFKANKIDDKQFLKLTFWDLKDTLGLKYYSDRKKIIDAQQKIREHKGPGGGQRSDVKERQNAWNAVEEIFKKKVNAQPAGSKTKEFLVSKMHFSRQNNLCPEKGKIPLKVHAIPTIGNVKLACWNAVNDREDEELPSDKDVFIVDFTKKKSISMVRNDTELGRVTNIGILWQPKQQDKPLKRPKWKKSTLSVDTHMFDAAGNIDDSLLASTNDRPVVEKEWDAFYSSAVSHGSDNVKDQPRKSLPPQYSKSVQIASGKRGSPSQFSASEGSGKDNCQARDCSHMRQKHIHHPSFMAQCICKSSAPCWTFPNCMPHPPCFQVDPRGCFTYSYQPEIQNPLACHLKPVKPTVEPQVSKPQESNPQVSKPQVSKSQQVAASNGFVQVDNEIFLQKQDIASIDILQEDLLCLDVIGKGQFGQVHKGTWKGMQVAIKEIKLTSTSDFKEVKLCSRLRHPNVIMLLGHVKTDHSLLLVTNYIKGQNLAKALGLHPGNTYPILESKWNGYVLFNICQGMAYISEKSIIHQDLKPANIMVEYPSHKPIICDLGVGKLVDSTHITNAGGNAGSIAYQHKEQMNGEKPTQAVDVYSFAVIMLETYSRMPVWKGMTAAQVTKTVILDNKYPKFDLPEVPSKVREIIDVCFQEACKRPTFLSLIPVIEPLVGAVEIW